MAQELVQLNPGQQVERWSIEKKLGEGGFGAVYRVFDSTGKYAMKVEGCNEQIQVLKLEVSVLNELSKRGNRHFCKIEDKGRFGNFNYVVMTLVGKSLQDLNKAGPGGHMTMGCSIGIGIQALEALEDLHNIGYLHRDVKPGNYTIGRPELNEIRKVYILDFGMCRKFTGNDGIIRKPLCSNQLSLAKRALPVYSTFPDPFEDSFFSKDDLETWMYMQVELSYGNLPWQHISDMNAVGQAKQGIRNNLAQLFPHPCPPQFQEIMRMVDQMKYYDAPNYQAVYGLMRQAYGVCGSNENAPYDWENGGPAAYLLH
ncbi:hypothetical protein CAEBREN_30705 [Caenorhabditis brenneri]|uniref:non-specific serine/threonine protein kinase n=1 Tax=Caenorhabditis brenneri TaxID=135651 RepID=G0PKD1_CAEBE|nr:hypothetical protein CAEBREN_30705 [Caenorhabditis brenneri]